MEVTIILCSNSYISMSRIDAGIRCIKYPCASMYYSVINTGKLNKTESSIYLIWTSGFTFILTRCFKLLLDNRDDLFSYVTLPHMKRKKPSCVLG